MEVNEGLFKYMYIILCLVDISDGYTFHGNIDDVFRKFFGGDNPFASNTNRKNTIKFHHPLMQTSLIWRVMLILMAMQHLVGFKDVLSPSRTHQLRENCNSNWRRFTMVAPKR